MSAPRRAALLAIAGTLAALIIIAATLVGSGTLDVAAIPRRTSWPDRVLATASMRSIRHHAGGAGTAGQ